MSENKGIAGHVFIGDGIPQGIETRKPAENPVIDLSEDARELLANMSEQDLRKFVRQEVHAALDDIARELRTGRAFQPVTTQKQAGTCCACLMAGDDMEWVGNRLAHKTDECRRKAAEMEPVREHRR